MFFLKSFVIFFEIKRTLNWISGRLFSVWVHREFSWGCSRTRKDGFQRLRRGRLCVWLVRLDLKSLVSLIPSQRSRSVFINYKSETTSNTQAHWSPFSGIPGIRVISYLYYVHGQNVIATFLIYYIFSVSWITSSTVNHWRINNSNILQSLYFSLPVSKVI